MKKLGLDVSEEVRQHEKMGQALLKIDYENRWGNFTFYAAGMKTLGFDVAEEVKEHEKQIWLELEKYAIRHDWQNFTQYARAMNALDLDVTEEVRIHETEIRKRLIRYTQDMAKKDRFGVANFVRHAVNMNSVGLDVTEEARQHEPEIRKQLQEYADSNDWLAFTHHARDMLELGLLTPNPQAETTRMPPLKEFKEK